ncbi:MAG: type II toxin-antitoxin system VapC family toxin [Alphaproteobacteria bacterium]|uniref:type II toxin-antitoxin system VapC family toxin n=1 Tax=Bradyrhizobium sp. TaxID=376 RepID=UPI001EB5EC9A|nr:type II toxin-antitoxin system VapC family toxin [Bradyrhizobium sp.]MBV9570847.1 type II toxin-antitoxin system VapC family toxin [Alphaproteobacteria bacterium]MBV9979097.1 type II toxin-antitoxin system VapC family toxin [Bradyrhizobium sp.]
MRTAATAENTYVDPSALLKLYLHEPESRSVAAWRVRWRSALAVTLFGRVEVMNGIGLALARKFISRPVHKAALAALDDDFAQGRLILADVSWRAAVRLAEDISRQHTPATAGRTLDILHVASALTLQRRYFLTFDNRQRKLAQAMGLKDVSLQ